MGLTRRFQETVKARTQRKPAFRDALLAEAIDSLIAGDVDVGKALLRDFIDASVGFEALSQAVGASPRRLKRMLSTVDDPTAANLFAMIAELQRSTGVHLDVTFASGAAHQTNAPARSPQASA